MVSPTPPDFFAESAKNPDHIVDANKMVPAGIPSEGEIQRLLFEFATCTDLAAGPSALDANARSFARAILDLIRPAFEAKEREIEQACAVHANATIGWERERGLREAAEAKLAQAVEALEPFASAIEDCDDDKAGDGAEIWEAPVAMCITYGDLRRARAEAKLREANMQALSDEGQMRDLSAKLAQAVEDEREACAQIAEDKAHTLDFRARATIASAIRARSAAAMGEKT